MRGTGLHKVHAGFGSQVHLSDGSEGNQQNVQASRSEVRLSGWQPHAVPAYARSPRLQLPRPRLSCMAFHA